MVPLQELGGEIKKHSGDSSVQVVSTNRTKSYVQLRFRSSARYILYTLRMRLAFTIHGDKKTGEI
jgi:hypothetical protein